MLSLLLWMVFMQPLVPLLKEMFKANTFSWSLFFKLQICNFTEFVIQNCSHFNRHFWVFVQNVLGFFPPLLIYIGTATNIVWQLQKRSFFIFFLYPDCYSEQSFKFWSCSKLETVCLIWIKKGQLALYFLSRGLCSLDLLVVAGVSRRGTGPPLFSSAARRKQSCL